MNGMQQMQAPQPMGPMGGSPPGGGQPPMGGPPPMARPMGGPQGGFSMPASGINLFKVQEQLKDMPQQMVMAYANGQNPSIVPPYIALGEMERRTRAAKNAQPAQAPQGTVKDALTQGLASLGGMQQMPPPQEQPEPQMMAHGGLAAVPVPARMTNYRDGGIVGYAGGEGVEAPKAPVFNRMSFANTPLQDPEFDEEGLPRSREDRARMLDLNARLGKRQREEQIEKMRPSKAEVERREQYYKPRPTQGPAATTVALMAPPATPSAAPAAAPYAAPARAPAPAEETKYAEFDPSKPPVLAESFDMSPERLPGIIAAIQKLPSPDRERAMQALTSKMAAMQGGLGSLAPAAPAPTQQNPFAAEYQKEIESSRALQDRLAAPPPPPTAEQQAAMNMPVEQDYFKRLQALAEKQGAGDRKTSEDIQSQRRMDLYQSLIAAGEATRGQRGLGALFGGMGASLGKASTARAGEEAKLRTGALDREALLEKAQYELRGLERARAEGNREKMLKHREELLKLERELAGNRLQGLASVTGAEMGAGSREAMAGERNATQRAIAENAVLQKQIRDAATAAGREEELNVKRANLLIQAEAAAHAEIMKEQPFLATTNKAAFAALLAERTAKKVALAAAAAKITMPASAVGAPVDLSQWGQPKKQ